MSALGRLYEARVLDVVEWSDAGWATVFLRLEGVVAPVVVDELYAYADHANKVGGTVQVHLQMQAYGVELHVPQQRFSYRYTLDFDAFGNGYVDSPLVPAGHYELCGCVVDQEPNGLVVDCGLRVLVGRKEAKTNRDLEVVVGDWIKVYGKLRAEFQW